jgi:LAS superfamily LD-carboxypeptidase LdcB
LEQSSGDVANATPTGLSEADGVLPDDATPFDTQYPGIANINPVLLAALQHAATDAHAAGITIYVTSGWRTPAYQEELFEQAVAQYGSAAEAAKWVGPADKSHHLTGNAPDIGGTDADTWLSKHGTTYNLCQIYANEPWHYEIRSQASTTGCPTMYANATQDPTLQ